MIGGVRVSNCECFPAFVRRTKNLTGIVGEHYCDLGRTCRNLRHEVITENQYGLVSAMAGLVTPLAKPPYSRCFESEGHS